MKSFSYKNLSFYYGKKKILDNVNITLNSGDVIALVGSNGVGKSTLLKIIAGLISVRNESKLDTSFLINDPAFYPYLTIKQNLIYFSKIYKNKLLDIDDVLNLVKLKHYERLKYNKCSLGMKRRLAIAKCLLKDADIYIFDEPLNGLDAKSIIDFREIIMFLETKNKIVIISSHILGELEKNCNKVFYINAEHRLLNVTLNNQNNYYIFKTDQEDYTFYGNSKELNDYIYQLVNNKIIICDVIKESNKLEKILLRGDNGA